MPAFNCCPDVSARELYVVVQAAFPPPSTPHYLLDQIIHLLTLCMYSLLTYRFATLLQMCVRKLHALLPQLVVFC